MVAIINAIVLDLWPPALACARDFRPSAFRLRWWRGRDAAWRILFRLWHSADYFRTYEVALFGFPRPCMVPAAAWYFLIVVYAVFPRCARKNRIRPKEKYRSAEG